jgi:Zn ribbon nucleic-acid-binding protein
MAKRYHGDQFTVKETVELFECPDCGFRFDAMHKQDDDKGGYVCPACRELELEAEVEQLRKAGELLLSQVNYACKIVLTSGSFAAGRKAMEEALKLTAKEEDDQ